MASLYVVATPIGNLEDASARVRRILSEVGLILAEDTRRTRALLSALDIPAPQLKSCHQHNEQGRLGLVTDTLERGIDVALVSDAGTPAISDPGSVVVACAHAAGYPVVSIAGPSSVVSAVAASGFSSTQFHFLGFPPRKAGALERFIIEASRLPGIFVMLERGARCGKLIAALAAVLPEREAVICREMSKKHEVNTRGRISELSQEAQRGEVVVVVGPGAPVEDEAALPPGPDLKAIAAVLSERWGCSKRAAYQRLLELEK